MGDTTTNGSMFINNNKLIMIHQPSLTASSSFLTTFAEDAARYVINKVVSLAVTKHHNKQVEGDIPQCCFTFTKRAVNTVIMSQYICYDKDDYKKDSYVDKSLLNIPPIEHKESKSSFNTTSRGHFDLDVVFYNNTYHGDNNWETPIEPTSTEVDRYASAMTNITKMISNSGSGCSNDNKRHTLISKRDSRVLGTLCRNSNNNENAAEGGVKKKKGWYEIMNEMSVHDIPWENNEDQIKQDNEFEELRKEKENELRMKEYEMKMKIKEEKEIQIKKKEEVNKQNKYKNKKITIDANGNVIIIKPFDMNILEKDFISIRSNSKNIKRMQPPSAVALHKQQQQSQHKKQLPTIETSSSSLLPQFQAQSNIEKKLERGPIVPSGSCFDKMKPEIGVCITEDKRSKTGGKDFFKKFNKYSLENYTKELQSTLSANMTYTATNSNNNNFAFTHSSNYMTNSDLHNHTLTDVNNYYNTISNSSFLKKKSHLTKLNHTAYNPLIKLSSTTNQFNLKCTLDDLNLISEQDEATHNNNTQRSFNITNIFKPSSLTSRNNITTNTLTDMNTFTSSLLKPPSTTSYQHQQTFTSTSTYAMKPSKPKRTSIEREIGKTALTTNKRMPRMRHQIMSKTFHNT